MHENTPQQQSVVHVMDAPQWTPQQALLSALHEVPDLTHAFIVVRRELPNGVVRWNSVIGGAYEVGDLFTASEILAGRARHCLSDPTYGYGEPGDCA